MIDFEYMAAVRRFLYRTVCWSVLGVLLFSAPVLAQICATPGKDGSATGVNAIGFGGTSQVVNTYYPGNASVSAGATSIQVGSPSGASTLISAGDLLLVIQIQDAAINSSNTSSYGDGVAGGNASGTTSDNAVGRYEYVLATGVVSGGSVPIQGATPGSGLVNGYVNANATSTTGQRRFQVIRVPQYNNCDIVGTGVPSPWNGRSGGVFAIDVAGTLTFSTGSAIQATGLGFRGGGGRQLSGGTGGSNTDYRTLSSSNYNAPKGEGIAGTPDYVHQSFTGTNPPGQVVTTSTTYPNGSQGRGAPGNAGGGGTDGSPSNNDENSGGGGGANGGAGGQGGNSWNSNLATGGHGGAAFASASITRLVMGGGGGAGSRNNSTSVQSSGGAGGGIVIVRAATITGTGIIASNGIEPNAANGLLPANDGGGGGGGAGTLVIFGNAGSLANITLQANGGRGGDCALADPAHGPGGGGGGGRIYVNDLLTGTVSVTGGANGETTSSRIAYGATSGSPGAAFLNAHITTLQNCGFVPVTLAYMSSFRFGKKAYVEWWTATETGNLGFNLYGHDGKEWKKVNTNIIPSHAVDSDAPLFYQYQLPNSNFLAFMIEDLDLNGRRNRSEEFYFEKTYGSRPEAELIPWEAIGSEHRRAENSEGSYNRNWDADRVQLLVKTEGIQRVTYEDLVSAGVEWNGVDARSLAITKNGTPIAIRVSSSKASAGFGNNAFGPGWSIDFLGTVDFSLYSDCTPYLLSLDQTKALRMSSISQDQRFSSLQTTHYFATVTNQENKEYSFASPLQDPWYQAQLLAVGQPTSYTQNFTVEETLKSIPANLEIVGYGLTDFPAELDHHLRFFINGTFVGEWFGNGIEVLQKSFPIQAGILVKGTNTLEIQTPSDLGVDAEVFNLEKFSINYPRELRETTDGLTFKASSKEYALKLLNKNFPDIYMSSPGRIYHLKDAPFKLQNDGSTSVLLANQKEAATPWTYHINRSSNFKKPGLKRVEMSNEILPSKAHYLIISHPHFLSGLTPLIQAREAQGLTVALVNVDEIYAKYSFGIPDAEAIAKFIAEADKTNPLRYVLLVGGDSYDYKNYLNIGSQSFIPTRYVSTGKVVQFAPSDASLADINRDGIPDLAIGRFPVRTQVELEMMLQKTLQFPMVQHLNDSLFVAGKDETAVSFTGFSHYLATLLPKNWEAVEAFSDGTNTSQLRQQIVNTINQGTRFVNFFGHSGPTVWTFENLLSAQHTQTLLTNSDSPTTVAQWGCWNTYFVTPAYNTMAHKFLLSGSQGAAAVVGAATLTEVSSEQQFAPIFFKHLFALNKSLGEAIQAAKAETALQFPELKDIYLGLHLLGDPALEINP